MAIRCDSLRRFDHSQCPVIHGCGMTEPIGRFEFGLETDRSRTGIRFLATLGFEVNDGNVGEHAIVRRFVAVQSIVVKDRARSDIDILTAVEQGDQPNGDRGTVCLDIGGGGGG